MGHSAQTRNDAVTRMSNGETLASVHHDTGIPRQTLSDWARKAGLDLAGLSEAKTHNAVLEHQRHWERVRAEMADQSGDVAGRVLTVVREALEAGELEVTSMREAQAAATVYGILVDKAQLLSGAATQRIETDAPERNPEQGEELAAVLELVTDVA